MAETESEIPDWIELEEKHSGYLFTGTFIHFAQLYPGDTGFEMIIEQLLFKYNLATVVPVEDNFASGWDSKRICCQFMIEKWQTPDIKISIVPRSDLNYDENYLVRKLEDWFIIYLKELSKKIDFDK